MKENKSTDFNLFSLSPDKFAENLPLLLNSIRSLEKLFPIVFHYLSLKIAIQGMQITRLEGSGWRSIWSSCDGPLPWEMNHEKRNFLDQQLKQAFLEKRFCYFSWPLSPDYDAVWSYPFDNKDHNFLHHFLFPLIHADHFQGVIHYWFKGENHQNFLEHQYQCLAPISFAVASCLGQWIKDITVHSSSSSTLSALYVKYIEELAMNEHDRDKMAHLLVNYAREAAGCDRSCLFAVPLNSKGYSFLFSQDFSQLQQFELKAASSLVEIQKHANQALILKEAVVSLVKVANPQYFVGKPKRDKKLKTLFFSFLFGDEKIISSKKEELQDETSRSPLRIGFAMREGGSKERPKEIIDYFNTVPMNWIAAFPLMDDEKRIFGFLSWEGQEPIVANLELFNLLQRICLVGGRSFARVYFKKKAWLYPFQLRKPLVFIALLILFLGTIALIPLPMKIKADAVLLPSFEISVPAMVSARIDSIHVQVGDYVKRGALLMTLDSTNIRLKIKEIEQDYKKNMAEADLAQNLKQETAMQLARLNALKSQAMLKSLYKDYQHTFIRAPIDGLVMGPYNLATRRGEVTQIGEVLVQLADPRYWKVKGFLKEQDLIYLANLLEKKRKPLPISFKLFADPTKSYRLFLNSTDQFVHGAEVEKAKYEFSFLIPWEEKNINPVLLKKGFRGIAKIYVGIRPLGEIAFRDIVRFLKIHVFFW
ncbi:biotin/lipoyl-binding protein [Methylacidiphilum caldifontis]|uniref:efflux RND transporter periplasmic adaptor subunit n=1 Tax=Methylacidiphilum caldifontis TaxID=2795386 RepID=UPI001A900AA7|nr:biotin/lipoyl-binding protein [Methylacidiphilum caldifontis]QSR89425.1 biotin/lipoyl-binding protein [Methylacidiphilum caldifontis]